MNNRLSPRWMMVHGEESFEILLLIWGYRGSLGPVCSIRLKTERGESQILESRVNDAVSVLKYEIDLQIPWGDRALRFEKA